MAASDTDESSDRAELVDYLASAGAYEDVASVIESVLSAGDARFTDLAVGLSELVGSKNGSSRFLAHLMSEAPDDSDLEAPEMRLLRAKYRARIRRSFDRMSEGADDWRFFHREVFRDVIDDEWVIHSTIEKVTGEKLFVSTPISSYVRLVTRMLQSLTYVPVEELDEDDRASLVEVLDELGLVKAG